MTPSDQDAVSMAAPHFRADGLWQALGRLDRMLERATASADAAAASAPQAEAYRGLYITSEDVSAMLRREPGQPFLAGKEADGPDGMPEASRFPWLQQRFDLTPFDIDVMLIALAPEVDLRYERLFAYLQDDVTRRRPTVDLALNLLCATREAKIGARARFAPDAPLLAHRLLSFAAEDPQSQPPLLAHALKLDGSVVRFLLGQEGADVRLGSVSRLKTSPEEARLPDALAKKIDQAVRFGQNASRIYLEGSANGAQQAAAARIAVAMKSPLLTAHLGKLAAGPGEFEPLLDLIFREAKLLNTVLLLEDLDSLRSHDRTFAMDALRQRLDQAGGTVIVSGERPCDPRLTGFVSIILHELGYEERRAVWEAALRESGAEMGNAAVEELASRYRLNASQIRRAVDNSVRAAAVQSTQPLPTDFARAAREQAQRDLGSLARRVRPVNHWADLILPADQIAQLQEVCASARHRHIVFGEWGFDRKLSLGKGLSALFSGPPGTGKTMAVEVIANDLGIDLYKIDLSQVVSKYIGETEKNIDRLFAEARSGNAILFFDECDALFGKRTAVQDAHDRYANIEVAYLLQKMDEHDGLSILATNLRQNLDPAFTRRLTFIVEFPFPDEPNRRRIWDTIWPAEVPRSRDLDLEFLATQFKLPGGAVKNIAVAAAFLAAEAKGEVTTERLLWATRRELEKSGRSVSRSEFGRYADKMQALQSAEARP